MIYPLTKGLYMTKYFDIIQKVYEGWLLESPWQNQFPTYTKTEKDLTIDFGSGNYIIFEDHDDTFIMKAYPQTIGIQFSIGVTNLLQITEKFILENITK